MKARTVAFSFLLGVRTAVRSRLVAALVPPLAAAAVALPLWLETDGTEQGALRMAVSWPLSAAFAILAAATLCSGSAAFASEIERRRFVSEAVSPAGAFDIWLGRWLAVVALDEALLAAVAAAVFAVARYKAPAASREPVKVLLRRDEAYDEELAARLSGGDPAKKAAALEDLRSGAFLPVAPGEARAWRFFVPSGEFSALQVDFSLLSSYGMAQGVDGALALRPPQPGASDIARFELSKDSDGTFHAELPAAAIRALDRIDVAFENREDPETGAGALVSHVDSLRLSRPGRGLAANLFLAWAVMLAALSFAAALALLCGAAFSPPVATFVSTGLALALFASAGGPAGGAEDAHDHGEPREKGAAERAVERFSEATSGALSAVVSPVVSPDAIGRAGDGVGIDPGAAASAVVRCGVALPLLVGFFAAATLRRRQLN